MENICIRFAGIDQSSGALFLQFSKPEYVSILDQSTIHAFFPHQYDVSDIEELVPYMAAMGQLLLAQKPAIEQKNQLTDEQVAMFSGLVGTYRTVETDSDIQTLIPAEADPYGLDASNNPNAQIDQIRCVVLEILAEEGLIPGAVK